MSKRAHNEGSVYQLTTGQWQAHIVVDGKRIRRNADTQAAAVKILNGLRRQRDDNEPIVDAKLTVADVCETWRLKNQPNRGYVDTTMSSNLSHLAAWTAQIGTVRVAKLTVADIEAAMVAMSAGRAKPLTRNTMTKRRSVLGMVFDAAMRRGQMTRNPARLAELPGDLTAAAERRALTDKQAERIIRVTHDRRNGAAYLVALSMGLRPGELLGLRWSTIDFAKSTMRIQYGIRMIKGNPILVDDLKTAGSLRTLVMPDYVAAALREQRALQRKERLAAEEWQDHDLVFPRHDGKPMDLNKFRADFDALTSSLGYGEGWTPNEMRHTAATLLLARGVPLEVVADILGHNSTRMLEQHYRHATKPAHDGHVAAMQTMFGKAARAK